MNTMSVQEVMAKVKSHAPVVIITHHNPDGDAIGSSLALYHLLKEWQPQTNVLVPNEVPAFLHWMPGYENITVGSRDEARAAEMLLGAGIIFCLDFNGPGRVEQLRPHLENSKAVKVVIDHHPFPESFPDYIFSDTTASSTCELILDFTDAGMPGHTISPEMAACVYTGIMTDTGSFKFRSCTAKTHMIIARLLQTGIDKTRIHQEVLDTNSTNRLRMLGNCLLNSLQVFPEIRTATMTLSLKEQEEFQSAKGDTEGFVNYCLSIKGVDLAALFIEHAEHVKISFRSRDKVDVNSLARRFFNGGGHVNAAGGKSSDSLVNTHKRFVETVFTHAGEIL